jgi:hypothetical protein
MRYALVISVLLLLGLFGCPGIVDDFLNGGNGNGEELPPINGSGYGAEIVPEQNETVEEEGESPLMPPPEPGDPREMLEHFILNKMMGDEGEVRNEFANGRAYVLAETTGQMMEYALYVEDKELFDKEVALLENHFINQDYGVAYASLWADDFSPRENMSNTDDDMRFADSLTKAHEKWGGEGYLELRNLIAAGMVEYNSYQGILSKGVEWEGDGYEVSKIMDIDDMRWETMQVLAGENPIWRVMLEKTTPRFLECQDDGLLWQEYDISKNRPSYPEGSSVSETSHMLRATMYFSDYKTFVPASALNVRMKNEWASEGKISSAYYMENLGTGTGNETMETYALAARNAIRLGDCGFAIEMKERILMDQVDDAESEIYGSVSRNREENGILDDLDTLLMLIELESCGQ